jgi:hypothetical protein
MVEQDKRRKGRGKKKTSGAILSLTYLCQLHLSAMSVRQKCNLKDESNSSCFSFTLNALLSGDMPKKIFEIIYNYMLEQ